MTSFRDIEFLVAGPSSERSRSAAGRRVRGSGRMFVRFVVGHAGEHHRLLTGLITEARLLRDRGELASHERDLLEEIYDWFNAHVPVPPYSSSRWPRDTAAWFKDTSPAAQRMWEIAELLKAHDVPVRLLRSRHPGKFLYEDAHQVVVAEFREL